MRTLPVGSEKRKKEGKEETSLESFSSPGF